MTLLNRVPFWQYAGRALFALAALLLLSQLLVLGAYAANLLAFPFDYDQGEGYELEAARYLSRLQLPYQDVDTFPYYGSHYPPLFHILLVPFVWLFGPAYWYGRAFSLLCALLTAGAIGYAVRRESGNRSIAALAALAFLASNTVYHQAPLFRHHPLMVLLETLAVVCLASAPGAVAKLPCRRLALSFALVIAAGYAKQLALFTAMAMGGYLLLRAPRRAWRWGLASALVGIAVFAAFYLLSGGEWWRQIIISNANRPAIEHAWRLARLWLRVHGWLIGPAALLVCFELYFARFSLYSLWFVSAALFGGISSGGWGAGDNYYMTVIAATCILSGIFAARMLDAKWCFSQPRSTNTRPTTNVYGRALSRLAPLARICRGPLALLPPLLYLGYALTVLHIPTDAPGFRQLAQLLGREANVLPGRPFYDGARTALGHYPPGYSNIGHFTTTEDIQAGWQIVEWLREVEDPVISEDAGFAIRAGKQVVTQPPLLWNLAERDHYDSAALIAQLAEREFGAIVLRAPFFPADVEAAIYEHYETVAAIPMNGFNYRILEPRAP